MDGRFSLRTEDLTKFVERSWIKIGKPNKLSEYGEIRTARDLLRMARDLGLLVGDGIQKAYLPMTPSDETAIYICQYIADIEGASSKVPQSKWWATLLMAPQDVERLLLRLHQFKKIEYQVAGSLVDLKLPFSSSLEYAEALRA